MVQAMRKNAGNISQLFFLAAFLALFALAGVNAYAAAPMTAEGCDPLVEKAQEARADMRVAYDVAVTEEHLEKPDSTLATTCFNDLSGVMAGGNTNDDGGVFSGDFTSAAPSGEPGGLRSDIQDSLQAFYTGFADAMGADSGLVDYTNTALTNTATCNETQDLWTQVKQGGVEQGVPNATLKDLLTGTLPNGANTDYTNDWNTSSGTDQLNLKYQNALAAQPAAFTPTIPQSSSFCQAMIAANIPGAGCP